MKILERLRNRSSQDRAREQKAALVKAGIRSDPPATPTELDHPPVLKTNTHHSAFDRVDAQRDARNERERLELYRARLYGGRAASQSKLRELQRASDGAAARLRRAEAAAIPTHPPT
jgi:hypothetical protein